MKIVSDEIGVVIQGAIHHDVTQKAIESVRAFLPHAQIVVSTWRNDTHHNLQGYDHLVLNDDPGFFLKLVDHPSYPDNTNRQIVSTLNGLKRIDRKYALKIRSDCYLHSLGFLDLFSMAQQFSREDYFLKSRLVIANYGCINYRIFRIPFHLSDWMFFGFKDDVLDIWNIPLAGEEHQDFYIHHPHLSKNTYYEKMRNRFSPEQYVLTSFFKKKGTHVCDHGVDISKIKTEKLEMDYINNFIWETPQTLGLTFPKYQKEINEKDSWHHNKNYTFKEWLLMHRQLYGGK